MKKENFLIIFINYKIVKGKNLTVLDEKLII